VGSVRAEEQAVIEEPVAGLNAGDPVMKERFNAEG
jgi:hypothetical protein